MVWTFRKLLEVSELEQELVSDGDHPTMLKQVRPVGCHSSLPLTQCSGSRYGSRSEIGNILLLNITRGEYVDSE
jgi:hypothetical protein